VTVGILYCCKIGAMSNTTTTPRSFWLTLLAFNFIANLVMARLIWLRQVELKSDMLRSSWSAMILFCLLLSVVSVWTALRVVGNKAGVFERLDTVRFENSVLHVIGIIVFAAIVFLIPYLKFTLKIGQDPKEPLYDMVLLSLLYYWFCWWLILLAATALKAVFQISWEGGFATALVILGVVFEVMVRYNFVTNYPLSMGWSEGSRYYYASLFFSKQIYGETFPLSTLHPTRYLLQSFPFLFPSIGIFAHRFWQFLLWIGLTAGASIAVTKRAFKREEKALIWLAAGWLFLFLLRVGVYYHLEVMVILPMLFVTSQKPRQSLFAVIVASLWAGISRVNWFPVPAMIAIAIYLLETPLNVNAGKTKSLKQSINYLSQPALWGIVGLASALFSQWAYVYISGNAQNADAFTSSFTSDLLWYRLWPNPNFPLGVIPAILLISGPLLVVIIFAMRQWNSLHTIRWAGLIAMLLALFAGSAVVSTKIGGGGDLHNMDTYTAFIGIVGLYFVGGRVAAEPGAKHVQIRVSPVSAIALVIPLLILVPALSPYPKYKDGVAQRAHQQLVDAVNIAGQKGPVLFISDRQMLSLGDVKVPLVYDYEVVTVMEMAMSGNQAYLNRFYDDLANHRFTAIVSGRQSLNIKLDGDFVEENNVWNTYVAPYILCYYESSQTITADQTRLEIYVPRIQSGDCPSRNIIN
jgi:hypothetical protein